MSYQEIKKISRGKKWIMVLLMVVAVFLVFFKKVSRAQNTFVLGGTVSRTEGNYACNHNYSLTYTFKNTDSSGVSLENGMPVHKCEPVTVQLLPPPNGLWGGSLVYLGPRTCADLGYGDPIIVINPCSGSAPGCDSGYSYTYQPSIEQYCCVPIPGPCGGGPPPCGGACGGCGAGACGACGACGDPPADVIDCDLLDACLGQGNFYSLDSQGQGKGVVKNPAFPDLASQSPNLVCAGHECRAYSGGAHAFQEKINATKYYGQCVDTGVDIKLEGDVPEVTNSVNFSVANRTPQITNLAAAANPIAPEQSVELTCSVSDPDCQGDPNHKELSHVTWNCVNAQGKNAGCYFEKDGIVKEGKLVENLNLADNSQYSNPYQSAVWFRAHNFGDYAVTCEVQDNDLSPQTARSTLGISVSNQFSDAKYCSILNMRDNDEIDVRDTVCVDNELSRALVNYKAYLYNIDPEKYYWKCNYADAGDPAEGAETKQCDYGVNSQSYRPFLSVKDRDAEQPIECNRTVSTRVTCIPMCSVGARTWGSGEDLLPSLGIAKGEDVEAGIRQQCLAGGETSWNVINGTIISSAPNNKLRVRIGDVLQSKVQATITKNGTPTVCDEATVEVKEKVEWRR